MQKANCELSEYRVHKQQIYLYECVIGSEDTHTCRWFCIEQERRSNNHHHYLSACTQHTLYNNLRTSLQVLFNIYATLLQDFFFCFFGWITNNSTNSNGRKNWWTGTGSAHRRETTKNKHSNIKCKKYIFYLYLRACIWIEWVLVGFHSL